MSGVTTGTMIAAGVGAAGSIAGGLLAQQGGDAQASAMEQGQQTQATSLAKQLALQQKALDQQQTQYTQNVAMEQPYMNAGAGALSEYDQLLGITPQNAAGTPAGTAAPGTATTMNGADQLSALADTPGYQFQLQQGEQAIQNQASATTGVLSTAENQAATRYAEGLAGTTYNSFMDRLNGVNTEGQQAASQTVAAGQANSNAQAQIVQGETNATAQTGNNISQLQAGVGAAQASGFNGAAGALTGGANNISNQIALGSLLNKGGGGTNNINASDASIGTNGVLTG